MAEIKDIFSYTEGFTTGKITGLYKALNLVLDEGLKTQGDAGWADRLAKLLREEIAKTEENEG